MNIVMSFIGILPEYIIYCIYQIRIYTDIPIFLIHSDYSSNIINTINYKFKNIFFIKYHEINNENLNTLEFYKKNFAIINGLKSQNREHLFYRSFERTYLLHNFMDKYNIENVLFLEIDNLIYDDPNNWFNNTNLIDFDCAFMIDNVNRASIGFSYFKNKYIVKNIIDFFDLHYLPETYEKKNFFNEMTAYYLFYINNKNKCLILPSFINNSYNEDIYKNFNKFNSIFDPSTYGIWFSGYDKVHSKNKFVINRWGIIKNVDDINKNTLIFKKDNDNLNKPFYINNGKYILINNLHVHSKNLQEMLSKEYL